MNRFPFLPAVVLMALLVFCPHEAWALLDIKNSVDSYDVKYVRIRCLWKNKYLYELSGTGVVKYQENLDPRDLRSHWFIQRGPVAGQYWIRNRVTGGSMNVESQSGTVQIAPFQSSFTSHRWVFEPDSDTGTDFFRIRSAWQSGEYFSTEIETDKNLTYAGLQPSFLSERFVLEDVPHGATQPWVTYDEDNLAALSAPAEVIFATTSDLSSMAVEAQKRRCILLNGYGTYARWTVQEAANALNLRYSVTDGTTGTITMKVTPLTGTAYTQKIAVTSTQAWLYYDNAGNVHDTAGSGWTPMKRYNDVRILLSSTLQAGDTLEFTRNSGDVMIWIDLVEAETAQTVHTSTPLNYYSVKDAPWNAKGNGTDDDTSAFQNCINSAASNGKGVFIPSGRYKLTQQLVLPDNTTLQGAGIWYSELVFTRTGSDSYGGLAGNGSGIRLRDFYLKGSQSKRDIGHHGIKGYWGTGSIIENVWVEQTQAGAWIGDYSARNGVADGLIIRNCRFRNTFADGINMAQGTVNSQVDNCHIRGAGDDGLASWASGYDVGVGMASNQQYRYNTIECGDRAGGIGIFGGVGHKIHHNLVQDQVAGAGIRFNTVFLYTSGTTRVGYDFGTADSMRVYENTLYRVGTPDIYGNPTGGIDLQTKSANVQCIDFSNLLLDSCPNAGIQFSDWHPSTGYAFQNITFKNVNLTTTATGAKIAAESAGTVLFNNVTAPSASPTISNSSTNFTIIDGSAPSGLSGRPGNASVYLDWNAPGTAMTTSGYMISRSAVPGGPYTLLGSSGTNSYTDGTAQNNATYYYVISSTSSYGETAASAETAVSLGHAAVAVNCGGGASRQFLADAGYSGGNVANPISTAIATGALASPAPQTVYQSERYGNFTYTFSGLVPGISYTVRLHFSENWWSGPGQRLFNVSINGSQVLTNFDIYAAAGGKFVALIREFTATSNGSGQVTVAYSTVVDMPKSSGIEIIGAPFTAFEQWQTQYFGSPAYASAAANADPDGDGVSNQKEFIAGTVPSDPGSLFRAALSSSGTAGISLNWSSVAGKSYRVERASNLAGPWSIRASNVSATPPGNIYTEPMPSMEKAFYRVSVE